MPMQPIIVSAPDQGLNGLLPVNQLGLREAADGSFNIVYERGTARTAPGFTTFGGGLPLTGSVLNLFGCRIDGSDYAVAHTTSKIYVHNRTLDTWVDKTQSGLSMSGAIDSPVSYAVISHDDSDIYLNDDSTQENAYEHLVTSDGGRTNIQRWAGAGDDDFADLLGGDGYNGTQTAHRALQVGTYQNRLILIRPFEYEDSSKLWLEQETRVRWPQVGKLQSWSGSGSGAVDLRDMGGVNLWSAPLAGAYYIYQNNSIWDLRYVAGSTIFDPRPTVTDVGLLAYHLVINTGNVHYFVGSDFNVYAYYGGTVKKPIGDKVKDFLHDYVEPDNMERCFMGLDRQAKRLWVFIVPIDAEHATYAYGYDMLDGSWMLRRFDDKYGATAGPTMVGVLGASSYTTGETYRQALDTLSAYDVSDADDATQRYGDVLCENSCTLTVDATEATWCAGGLEFYCACSDVTFGADFTVGDIIRIADGSNWANCRYGTHFYTIEAVGDNSVALHYLDPSLGISDTTSVPADVTFTVWTDEGDAYAEVLRFVETQEKMLLADSTGNVYAFDESLAGLDYTTAMACLHKTPVFDGGHDGIQKRWPGLTVTARAPTADQTTMLVVAYKLNGFDATEGWTVLDSSWALDSTWQEKKFFINKSSPSIQFAFRNTGGSAFEIQRFKLMEPLIEEDR